MASFEERVASIRQRIASDASRLEAAAPPDPRWRAAAQEAAASLEERRAALRHRVEGPDPLLASARSLAEQTLSRQELLKGLKIQNQELGSQFHQALSTKLHKKSEHERFTELISYAAALNEKLIKSLMDQSNLRDKCAAVISDQFQDLEIREAKTDETATLLEKLEAAMSWFNKFLGFQVIGGAEGVKFVFDKINPQHPQKEYSFCIKMDNDAYNLVQCDGAIRDFEELVKDLNLSGDLVKFVRVAREKFHDSSVNGNHPISSVAYPEVPSVPFSPLVTTTINRTNEDVPNQSNSRSNNSKLPAKRRSTAPSPVSTRRSPRLVASSETNLELMPMKGLRQQQN